MPSESALSKLVVRWVGTKPPDAEEWEKIIEEWAQDAIGVGAVKIRNVGHGWWLEGARIGHIAFGMGPAFPEPGPPMDCRFQLCAALRAKGKQVIGRASREDPLSTEEIDAIRDAAKHLELLDPQLEVSFDQQPVLDLLAELERLRHG